jgi:membrane fusion protein (multidrug efflux system)
MPDDSQNALIVERPTPDLMLARARRRWIAGILAALVLAASAFSFVDWWTCGRFIEQTNNAYLRADSVVISPKVAGYVTELLVADNESIGADRILARAQLDDRAQDGP